MKQNDVVDPTAMLEMWKIPPDWESVNASVYSF